MSHPARQQAVQWLLQETRPVPLIHSVYVAHIRSSPSSIASIQLFFDAAIKIKHKRIFIIKTENTSEAKSTAVAEFPQLLRLPAMGPQGTQINGYILQHHKSFLPLYRQGG